MSDTLSMPKLPPFGLRHGSREETIAQRDAARDLLRAMEDGARVRIAVDLRGHLGNIKDETTRAFVEEAINCYEAGLHRSAIVMSWIAAVDVLYQKVTANHLAAFNHEAKAANAKWKDAVNADGCAHGRVRFPRQTRADRRHRQERQGRAAESAPPSERMWTPK
jgi:hypothetical protein